MAFSADRFIVFKPTGDCFPLATDGKPCPIIIDADEDPGVKMAVDNLQQDIFSVCGTKPDINTHANSRYAVLVGTYRSPLIQRLLSSGKLNKKELEGKREKYLLQTVSSPCDGVEKSACHCRQRQTRSYLRHLRTIRTNRRIPLVLVGGRTCTQTQTYLYKTGYIYRR